MTTTLTSRAQIQFVPQVQTILNISKIFTLLNYGQSKKRLICYGRLAEFNSMSDMIMTESLRRFNRPFIA